jgi:hypothetical protein
VKLWVRPLEHLGWPQVFYNQLGQSKECKKLLLQFLEHCTDEEANIWLLFTYSKLTILALGLADSPRMAGSSSREFFRRAGR